MHAASDRQLRALLAAAVLSSSTLVGAPDASTPAMQELQAAKLMEASLYVRQAGAQEWDKMAKVYSDLSAKYPDNAAIRNAQGELLWEMGRHGSAEECWKEAERLNPNDAVALNHLGGCALADGNARRAADCYARASRAEPEAALYHFNLANVTYLFRHELLTPAFPTADALIGEAMRHYAEAARLAPSNPDYVRGYAETFYGVPNPDWKSALRAWEHYLRLAPRKDFAWANLARIHLKLGQKDEARQCVAQMQDADFQKLKSILSRRIEQE